MVRYAPFSRVYCWARSFAAIASSLASKARISARSSAVALGIAAVMAETKKSG
jgi:hypothetical protein